MSFYTLLNKLENFDNSSLDSTVNSTQLARIAAFRDLENQKIQSKKAAKIASASAIGSSRRFTNILGL